MNDNQQNERRATWRKIVDEYLASDMTQKAFCQKHTISLPQFVYYHAQFKRKSEPQAVTPSFVPVKVAHHEKPVAACEVKLSLPNGFQCTFPSHTDVVQIRRLLEVLLSC
jgi:hypothetical protein